MNIKDNPEQIKEQIKKVKKKLNQTVKTKDDFSRDEVINLSQKLDELINKLLRNT
ncbi:Spo0E like sporulation regulatory protein [Halobacteroides halobius DSM 5150]|uniref:Spo0E like sporulation regulatory protein n=1 Tax=Halobacteroides halobius (strain ATCC 35273 / DSM 5150 / MD-1) TaxID=748449 RepID=L0K851_HALHC|nr:aspartyl-phosphate phosphatase Spo0E family protein [Halobacteroides halobius]AGB40725.1 Spo0E like sporulation regulatory protein [Halobacteroides halobius DSM 5150]